MYQPESNSPKPKKKAGRLRIFLKDTFSGIHLLRSIDKWGVWAGAVALIVLVALWNERSINQKEIRNKELQNKYDSIVVEFKLKNEIIYTEDEGRLRQTAEEMGFVPTKDNAYYKIEVEDE